jgi:hypothetical protein
MDRGFMKGSFNAKHNPIVLKGQLNTKVLIFLTATRFRGSRPSTDIFDATA